MYLQGWDIEGFGHFHDVSHRDLSRSLTVFVGPNESGKSTLFDFLTWMLFGASRGQRPRALAGGRLGGRLTLVDEAGVEHVIERFEKAAPVVRSLSAERGDEQAIAALTGGIDRQLFRQVLAFSLDDLRSIEKLEAQELRERLFAATVGGGGPSVAEVRRKIQEQIDPLWRRRADSVMTRLGAHRAALQARLEAARGLAGSWASLETRRATLEQELEEFRARARELRERAARYEGLERAWESWCRLQVAAAKLEALPPERRLASDARSCAVTLVGELRERARLLEQARAEEASARRRVDEIAHDPAILGVAAEVLAWSGELARFRAEREESSRAAVARLALERARGDALAKLGLGQTEQIRELNVAELAQLRGLSRDATDQELSSRTRLDGAARAAAEAQRQVGQLIAERDAIVRDEAAEGLDRELGPLELERPRILALLQGRDALRAERDEAVRRSRDALVALGGESLASDLSVDCSVVVQERVEQASRALEAAQTELRVRREQQERERAELEGAFEAAARLVRSAQLEADPAAVSEEATIRRLSAGLEEHQAKVAQLARLSDELETARRERDHALARLGEGWDLSRAAAVDVTEVARGRAQALGAELEEARRQARTAEIQLAEAFATLATLGPRPAFADPSAIDALRGRLAQLDVLDALRRDRDDARARASTWVPVGTSTPSWLRGLVIAAVVAALVLVALLVAQHQPGPALVALLVALLVAALIPFLRGSAGSTDGSAIAAEFASKLREHEAALARLSGELGLPTDAGGAAIAARRRALDGALEDARQEHAAAERHAELSRGVEARRGELEAARARLDSRRAQFLGLLRSMGLDPELSPDVVLVFLDALRDLATRVARHERLVEAERDSRRGIEVFQAELARTEAALGLRPELSEPASARTRALEARLAVAAASALKLASARDGLAAVEARRINAFSVTAEAVARAERDSRGLEQALRALLTELGVPSHVPPEAAASWLRGLASARVVDAEAREFARRCDVRERDLAAFEARLSAVQARLEPELAPSLEERLARMASLGARVARANVLAQRRASAERAIEPAVRALRGAENELREAHTAIARAGEARELWARARDAAGLPSQLDARDLETYLEAHANALAAERALRAHDVAKDVRDVSLAGVLAAVGPLCETVGLDKPLDLERAFEALAAMSSRLVSAQRAEDDAEAAGVELRTREEAVRSAERQHDASAAELEALLRDCAVADLAALEAAEFVELRRVELSREVEQLRTTVRIATGRVAEDPELRAEFSSGGVVWWREEAIAARAGAEDVERRRDERLRELQQVTSELTALGSAADIVQNDNALASAEYQLTKAARRVLVLQLAIGLLDTTLERFRRERQPAVLKSAARTFGAVSAGRYVSIRAEEGVADLIVEDTRRGLRRTSELSRGTAEQVYACLRFALAEDHAARGRALPMFLDDILVNADPERVEAMAGLIADVSARRQLLLFTCRPETVEALRRNAESPKVELKVIELKRYAGREGPVSSNHTRLEAPRQALLGESENALLAALRAANGPLRIDALVEQSKVRQPEATAAITRLIENGFVVREGRARGTTYSART